MEYRKAQNFLKIKTYGPPLYYLNLQNIINCTQLTLIEDLRKVLLGKVHILGYLNPVSHFGMTP